MCKFTTIKGCFSPCQSLLQNDDPEYQPAERATRSNSQSVDLSCHGILSFYIYRVLYWSSVFIHLPMCFLDHPLKQDSCSFLDVFSAAFCSAFADRDLRGRRTALKCTYHLALRERTLHLSRDNYVQGCRTSLITSYVFDMSTLDEQAQKTNSYCQGP